MPNLNSIKTKTDRLTKRALKYWDYCTNGVWNDSHNNWKVNLIKTLNLSVKSFLNSDLQSKACALTFRTLLALVPALALVCAIGRGFGLQDNIKQLLIDRVPSQATALNAAFGFVDSYLAQASGGMFVGVGVVFLLWTLISLLRNVEDTFNNIWQLPKGRSIWRMVTDYLAIFLVLPVLLICASGFSLFMSTSLHNILPFDFMQPAIEFLFDAAGVVLSWLFFAGTYMLVPNTKVKFRNAIIPGILVGTACQVLQWLFVSGQMYVAKYNAIYGSFSFLPLFLIWMQLVWLITLIGAVLCYSMQNIGEFNFGDNVSNISSNYKTQATLAITAIIAKRFVAERPAMSISEISQTYKLPVNLVSPIVRRLYEIGLLTFVENLDRPQEEHGVQPAFDVNNLTAGRVISLLQNHGSSGFIPDFNEQFEAVVKLDKELNDDMVRLACAARIIDLDIKI